MLIDICKKLHENSLNSFCYEMDKTSISMFEILEPGGQLWANTAFEGSQFGKRMIERKWTVFSPIRLAPCVDFTKIKPHFQTFQQNDTQGTIDE